ncbi:putative mediator of RNA polymerase II transcription subunit 26 isoform X2 [Cydia pomonella]|uniref:putative mediator of RNA polymerase II transcription subunit 26 isoform X2 n=1 Tax=Cydia pomonella TaxID=82600 RepID=UPI002ADE0B34|nr:putative mediator of RNA polymerase II transcription subunit 26 isoform X2 [Cydia pomonella]
MEWWHIGPLVLAVLVFLLAGTVIERHVETAVLHFVNRHPPQSQATVAVETSDGQDLQQQQDDWLQQQLLKKKEELEQQELLLQKLQQQELQKGQRLQQEAQQQHELLDHQLLRKRAEFPTLLEKQHTETLQEVKPSEKKSLPNTSVNRQFSASQAAWKPIVTSSQLQQEPQLVPSKQRQQSLHQQSVQPIKQRSLQQAVQPIKQQSSQQQQSMQQQQQRQGLLMKQQSQQHSDTQPPLPFVAVSEKSILQPTSKTTVGSKAMDMQFNPKP